MKLGLIVALLFFSAFVFASLPVTISDQGTNTYTSSGTLLTNGNLTVLFYDQPTGGTPIFNTTYTNAIMNGSWNLMLTNVSLEFDKVYWKDYEINGQSLFFDGNDRIAFNSPLGDIQNASLLNMSIISNNIGNWSADQSNYYANISALQLSNTTTNGRIDALNGNLSNLLNGSFVPYVGANATVDLGVNELKAGSLSIPYAIGTYTGTNSPIKVGGIDYYLPGSYATLYWVKANTINPDMFVDDGTTTPISITSMRGDETINVNAVSILGGGITVYSDMTPTEIVAQLVSTDPNVSVVYSEPAFVPDVNGVYTNVMTIPYATDSGTTTWTVPANITQTSWTSGTGFSIAQKTADVTMASNLHNNNTNSILDWMGTIVGGNDRSLGYGSIFPIFVSQNVNGTTGTGTPQGAMGFVAHAKTPDGNTSIISTMGIFGGTWIEGNNTVYSGLLYGIWADLSLLSGEGNVTNAGGFRTGLASQGGNRTISQFASYQSVWSNRGSSTKSTVENAYDFKGTYLPDEGGSSVFDVEKFTGIYLPDNSPYATNAYGVYSEEPKNYFAGIQTNGTISANLFNGAMDYSNLTNIPNFSSSVYVPYTGANATVDLGVNELNAGSILVAPSNYGTGSIGNLVGETISTPENSGGGTIGNIYGLVIQDQSGIATGDGINIYSAGSNSQNVFEGTVTVNNSLKADYISVSNPDPTGATSLLQVTDNNHGMDASIGVNGARNSGDSYSDMGYTAIFGAYSVIPIAFLSNNQLAWYLSKTGQTGFYTNRPRGIFDIANQIYSMGLIYLTDQPQDGDTITITDADSLAKTFEFDNDNSVSGSNIKVHIDFDVPDTTNNLQIAISSSGLNIDSDSPNWDNVELKQRKPGVVGDIPITKSEAGSVINIAGMTNGQDLIGAVDVYFDDSTGDLISANGATFNGTVQANNYVSSSGNPGITDNTSYWMCTSSNCATSCQVHIENGLIVGCT